MRVDFWLRIKGLKAKTSAPPPRKSAGAWTLELSADGRDVHMLLDIEADPARTRYRQVELLRRHLYALALGHVHQDDQDLLAHDAGLKPAVWNRPGQGVLNERLASQPSHWRLMNRLSTQAHRVAVRLRCLFSASRPPKPSRLIVACDRGLSAPAKQTRPVLGSWSCVRVAGYSCAICLKESFRAG